ncbi:MAG: hypothetical protein WCP20_04810 [Desulfuromonadales bacterium]
MPRTLSGSPQKRMFCEYLTINGLENDDVIKLVAGVDSICNFIETRYSGASRIDENAFNILQKLAVEAHTLEQFIDAVGLPLNVVGGNSRRACELFYNYFADTKSIEESFASYMVGRYRLGYPYLALYWAAVLFERIITQKWRLQDTQWYERKFDPDREVSLNVKIAELTNDTLRKDSVFMKTNIFKYYIFKKQNDLLEPIKMSEQLDEQRLFDTRMRLTNFRILRNRIMHELNPEMKEEMNDNHLEFITYVWLELLPKSFEQQLEKYPDIMPVKTIDTLFNTSADYMIRAVDETTKKELIAATYTAIEYSDFENLYTLRDKLLPLRKRLDEWLAENNTDLLTDILTPIDTTSAYIWMPMVSREKKIGKIAGVYNAAVSILATPLDFRVYLDFGGYAQTDRFSYYQFLESPEYTTFVKSFAGKKEMNVFDIDWYCFISNQPVPLPQWNRNRRTLIESAKHKLIDADIPITWNRMLHGYILEKDIVDEDGITFEWIEQRLKWIIQFYQAYIAFKPPMTFETYKMTRKDKSQ